jgi:hypothetical protein
MDLQARDWLPPVVGLVGGALAGLIAAMSAVIGKENKISEFRQAWIDHQREDLALIAAEAVASAVVPVNPAPVRYDDILYDIARHFGRRAAS